MISRLHAARPEYSASRIDEFSHRIAKAILLPTKASANATRHTNNIFPAVGISLNGSNRLFLFGRVYIKRGKADTTNINAGTNDRNLFISVQTLARPPTNDSQV